ncbi:hypothetical protein BO85DRAFT_454585 [Aspergillus piperis CBS 112811]|uniref:Uncharacterized protein n=1 Tax=Aspergillus piperis CBS 112811 TaxID=1448313 RepID=A0A8G1QRX7_9EURO|nr:hypothetical protein BO85DRAFT_454585 [Aspergillus piperis CBS 112811]RAH51811.1 hypothetical protein BO85DRAFT_454585 [Aspergillus piperis CBS 112811]
MHGVIAPCCIPPFSSEEQSLHLLDLTGKDVQRHISFHRLSTNALGGEISAAMKGILSECVLRFYKYSIYPDQCTNCG